MRSSQRRSTRYCLWRRLRGFRIRHAVLRYVRLRNRRAPMSGPMRLRPQSPGSRPEIVVGKPFTALKGRTTYPLQQEQRQQDAPRVELFHKLRMPWPWRPDPDIWVHLRMRNLDSWTKRQKPSKPLLALSVEKTKQPGTTGANWLP